MQSVHTLLLLWFCVVSQVIEARMYFLHVPKTGGTSLRLLLEQQLSSKEIYPFRNHKLAKGPVTQTLVSGHFPYWFCKKLDNTFDKAFKVTILRDPVQRYLSFLRYKKKENSQLQDLESVMRYEKYKDQLVDNALCRDLAANPHLEGEALLESAKSTLESVDCVIIYETYTQDVIDLFKRLGIDLEEKDIPKVNTTEPVPVKNELLEEVRRLNTLDMQLYQYAKNQLAKKETTYRLRTASFDQIARKATSFDYTFDQPLYGRGWTYREVMEEGTCPFPTYRWVMDRPAEIDFPLEEGLDYRLSFYAQTLTDEVVPHVRVNGRSIELMRVNHELFSLYQGIIPKESLTASPAKLSFYSDKAFQYRDIYPSVLNRNFPPLSFAVNRIIIDNHTL